MRIGRNIVKLCVIAGILVMSMYSLANEQRIVIIGHPGITDSLTQDDVQQIFLGRKTRWSDDSSISFLLYNQDAILEGFLKKYVKKTPFQYKNFWKKQVFTGKGRMPKAFTAIEGVLDFVSSTDGAISFALFDEVAGNDTITIIPVQE